MLNKYLEELFEGPCKGVRFSCHAHYHCSMSLNDLLLELILTIKHCHLQNEFVCSLFLDGPMPHKTEVTTGKGK